MKRLAVVCLALAMSLGTAAEAAADVVRIETAPWVCVYGEAKPVRTPFVRAENCSRPRIKGWSIEYDRDARDLVVVLERFDGSTFELRTPTADPRSLKWEVQDKNGQVWQGDG